MSAKSIHPFVKSIQTLLEKNANSAQAGPMKKYMRDQFEYLGIKSPQLKQFFRQHIKEKGLPVLDELDEIVRGLWQLPEREYQYFALSLIGKVENKLEPQFISTLEDLITTKSWWDTVDILAAHPVGAVFNNHPKVKERFIGKWRGSKNIWLRRTTLLFQLGYKTDTNFDLLCELIKENLGSDEFFINKAIGWALRQYAYIDPKAVKKFVKETQLDPLSRREAMKHFK